MEMIKRFWKKEDGAELVEIAVYVGMFVLLVMGGLTAMGTSLNNFFEGIGTYLEGQVPGGGGS